MSGQTKAAGIIEERRKAPPPRHHTRLCSGPLAALDCICTGLMENIASRQRLLFVRALQFICRLRFWGLGRDATTPKSLLAHVTPREVIVFSCLQMLPTTSGSSGAACEESILLLVALYRVCSLQPLWQYFFFVKLRGD